MSTGFPDLKLDLSAVKRDWIDSAVPIVERLSLERPEFTSDDLHGILPNPEEPNWFGILLAKMKRRGLIERVRYRPSTRPERNGAVIAVWKRKVAA